MSKIFYDKVLNLDKLDREIKKIAKTPEEREEVWQLVDEIVHHKAMGCILDRLPSENHEEFLAMFDANPYSERALFGYLNDKIGQNIEEILEQELGGIAYELLTEIKNPKK